MLTLCDATNYFVNSCEVSHLSTEGLIINILLILLYKQFMNMSIILVLNDNVNNSPILNFDHPRINYSGIHECDI